MPKIFKLGLAFITPDRSDNLCYVYWCKVRYHSVLFYYKECMRSKACISTYMLTIRREKLQVIVLTHSSCWANLTIFMQGLFICLFVHVFFFLFCFLFLRNSFLQTNVCFFDIIGSVGNVLLTRTKGINVDIVD